MAEEIIEMENNLGDSIGELTFDAFSLCDKNRGRIVRFTFNGIECSFINRKPLDSQEIL